MRLDSRIASIVSNIDKCEVIADIGCDHGKVAVYLAKNGYAKKVIASDISEKSVEKAKELAIASNLTNIIDIRVGNGTSVIKDNECDTIIIAGMGGITIKEILSSDKRVFKRMVLSPQSDVRLVREYLKDNFLLPIKDYKVECKGKYYDVLVIENGNYKPLECELEYGSGLGSDFDSFYDYERKRLEFIINHADIEKAKQAKMQLDLLEQVKRRKK